MNEAETKRQYEFMQKAAEILKKKEEARGRKFSYFVQTFGCQMNERDSEKLAGILKKIGYEEAEKEEEADIVLYNTCTVRDNADQRVFGRLGVLKAIKKKNPDLIIGLCGCMMQEPTVIEKIRESYKHVNLIFGTHNLFKLAELLVSVYESDSQIIDIWKDTNEIIEDLPVERKFPFKSGVNIMFGCNNFCSYCIVPYVRGRERSREPKDIIREIENLVKDGVKEVMLLGQNVNSYGKGLEPKITFAELLEEVAKIDGLERIRFMSNHPKDLSDDLIRVMASNDKVCKHMHLALQSGSDRLLEKMNRHYTKEKYLELVKKMRTAMPDIAITTDIIVGFPGETKEDIDETIDIVKKAAFDGAFTFIYSKRTGTPAASMPDQCSEEFIKEQFDRVLETVQETSKEQAKRFEGRTVKVLVEAQNDKDPSMVTGRMSQNHTVHFKGSSDLIGSIVDVHLDECCGFYFMGTQV
ncbi:tRNA-2-methylthio-N6-dimethylallyladenosine synthase [Lachnospiraceae bacterium KH1T2]|nr:tRNA-2-methylthio-N6-dimethylallyladenosine synthase [Lachnospiraceae bacterium KH1T2]